jgi:uncharacterized CHY-type Zn-finger protein
MLRRYWNCSTCGQGYERGFSSFKEWAEWKPREDCGLCRQELSLKMYHPDGR